jgi:Icc-related predicted phosphoesterase
MSVRLRASLLRMLVPALGLAVAGPACKEPAPPPAPIAPAPPPVPPAPPSPPPPASVSGQSVPDCVGPFTSEGAPTALKLGARTAKRTGAVLTVESPDADDSVVFGIVANLKEATGENLFNLGRYVAAFKEQKVEAILVAGDSGEGREGVAAVLAPLAATGLPTFVIPGNRESRSEFRAALEQLAKKHPNVVDMTSVRLVNFDDASIVSLPGYYDRRYVHVGEAGCLYFKEDVENLKPIVAAAKGPVVLLAHAEPYGKGPQAIDYFGDGNAGDLNLHELLASSPIPFGVFANIHEAGGRANDVDSNLVAEGTPAAKLFLNPGLADSTAWKLNDGTWSYGMVATLTVAGGQATYKSYKVPQLTDAEREAARKLEPPVAAAVP